MTANTSIDSSKLDQIQLLNSVYDKNFSVLVKKDFNESDLKTAFKLDEDKKTGRLGYIVISCDGKNLDRQKLPMTQLLNREKLIRKAKP